MFDFLLGATFGFYILFFLIFISLLVADVNENNVGAFSTLVAVTFVIAYYYSADLTSIWSLQTLKLLGLYLVIGFVFSLVRTYFKGRELDERDKVEKARYDAFHEDYKTIAPFVPSKTIYNLKAAVFRWWFIWPISAINWVLGRILVDLYNWIYSKIVKLYEKIFNS